jgi:hypothetical protein
MIIIGGVNRTTQAGLRNARCLRGYLDLLSGEGAQDRSKLQIKELQKFLFFT